MSDVVVILEKLKEEGLSWCASCESNMLEIDLIELFRGLQ